MEKGTKEIIIDVTFELPDAELFEVVIMEVRIKYGKWFHRISPFFVMNQNNVKKSKYLQITPDTADKSQVPVCLIIGVIE